MQIRDSRPLFSASDLVAFNDCKYLGWLDFRALTDTELRSRRCGDDEQAQLIQRKGQEFEARYLAHLEATCLGVVRIETELASNAQRAAATLDAMRRGVSFIYQATLLHDDLIGHADFLKRVERPSQFGDWSYEVVDTKLARTSKPKFVLQLSFYSELLELAQGSAPQSMHVVLGRGEETTYRCADYSRYFRRLLRRFRATIGSTSIEQTFPDPCERCSLCHWRELCEARRESDDSLWLVADIRATQVQKLHSVGITTLTDLASVAATDTVPTLAPETLAKLRSQAALQLAGRESSSPLVELLQAAGKESPRGFERLAPADWGDVYFDMEGDPLFDDGLEYLFGVVYRDADMFRFKAFWAHDRAEERTTFEDFMDWLGERIRQFPNLHVYHYAAYENTALKRLAGWHGTREEMLDQLLRDGRLVDLYRVVREAIRVSLPSYSIKHIERLYRPARAGDVQTAGSSIVFYERWLATGEQKLLDDIERYNEDDCRSLQQLHDWLLLQRPPGVPWLGAPNRSTPTTATQAKPISDKLQAYLDEVSAIRTRLLARLPAHVTARSDSEHWCALMADLLEFHRRSEKPQWWETFARGEMTFEELLDTPDAIAGLQRVSADSDTYEYPEQQIKFRVGDRAIWLDHPARPSITIVELDEDNRRITLSASRRVGELPDRLSLGATGPINSDTLKQAVLRAGASVVADDRRYPAIEAVLQRRLPQLNGRTPGDPIVVDSSAPMGQIVEAVAALNDSCLFIQGPPGAGKTYTGSHVLVELLRRGKRVAVSSNSHKAINNLLKAVDKLLVKDGLDVAAAKKSTRNNPETFLNAQRIVDVDETDYALSKQFQLVGGTAWLFANPVADQEFDFLFVDEAGQVSLGHLVAMATCARSIVLLGDQMQLGQPVQGVHPGRSGESSLDFLLDGRATVPPDAGIFLPTTWRMCPDVCRFISDAVYDGRLEPESLNINQRLVLAEAAHPALRPTGVAFWPIDHLGCSQRSEEEAQSIRVIYEDMLRHRWIDRAGQCQGVTPEDILIVAPYNMQVSLLKRVLPAGARVGTVDKFQGQEAAVVLMSMTTSTEDDLPHHLEFLFSKNRLNVAISRARCLSIVIANPRLLDTHCRTVEQVALVNTLCWAHEFSMQSGRN